MMRLVNNIIAISLGILFFWAGMEKLLQPDQFYEAILSYKIINSLPAIFVTYTLPSLEIILGIFVMYPKTREISLLLIITLTCTFIGLILISMLRGLDITCGCFGGDSNSSYLQILLRDIGILVFASTAFFLPVRLISTTTNGNAEVGKTGEHIQ